MRALVIVICGLVVAAAVIALLSVSTDRRTARISGCQDTEKERIDALQRNLSDAQQHLRQLNAAVGAIEDRLAELGARIGQSPTHQHSPSGSISAAHGADVERLRQVVREEIARPRQSWRSRASTQPRDYKPEKWETDEFGHLASWVHNRGRQLRLTDDQKRKYHAILQEYQDRIGKLWDELKKEYPNSRDKELVSIYQKRESELVKDTRKFVTDILNREQQKKYRQLFHDNDWHY